MPVRRSKVELLFERLKAMGFEFSDAEFHRIYSSVDPADG